MEVFRHAHSTNDVFFIELVSSESKECRDNEGFTMSHSTLYDIKKRYRELGNINQAFKKIIA
jgi:hypothetical protein